MIARVVDGDRAALGEVFKAHSPRVYRLAYGITRSRSEAEDVVQDVFTGLPESLATFEGRAKLSTWLHKVAVRTAVMRLSDAQLIETVSIELAAFSGRRKLFHPLDRIALRKALNALPGAYRAVIWLRVVEGWKHSEISDVLEITETLSQTWVQRARRLLRNALCEQGWRQ